MRDVFGKCKGYPDDNVIIQPDNNINAIIQLDVWQNVISQLDN
jgi:hypothetical protein